VYTVSLRLNDPAELGSDGEWQAKTADYEMRALARETGARSFFPRQLADLEGAYASIARELSHQYAIGFIPSGRSVGESFRRVAVTVAQPNVRVRVRTGYIAGG
jgi:VWFA-related protein